MNTRSVLCVMFFLSLSLSAMGGGDLNKNLQEAVNKAVAEQAKKDLALVEKYTKEIEQKKEPEVVFVYKLRAETYVRLNRHPDAIADYSKVIEINPKDESAYGRRGFLYSEQQKYTEAIADFTKIIELNPKDFNAYYNRGLAYKAIGKNKQAYADGAKAKALGKKP